MKLLRALLVSVLAVALVATTAYGVDYVVRHDATASTGAERPATAPAPEAPEPQRTVDAPPVRQGPVLEPGDRSDQVRELQSRLSQLDWFPELTTGRYDAATDEAVRGFQARRGLEPTGVVDLRTWERLLAMTEQPTHDQLLNVLQPGPALLAAGDRGEDVRAVQHRLVQIAWLFDAVTGSYDPATVDAVKGFQGKRGIPVTGEIDQRTMDRLLEMTRQPTYDEMHNIEPEPGALDPRCTTGRVLCVDKTTNTLRWVVDGDVQETFDVRFGSDELPTREGEFSVRSKSPDHVSSLYGTPMPFAMFFSGGQAVHYSPDFAAVGYNGASHGCVNVRDYAGIAALFDEVVVGDRVVVHWS
ncbi:MAG: L,D-transpeptidase family protein [Nocardioides sp.]